MRFTKPFWEGIESGAITVAFRSWKTPTVVVGRPYRTGGGRIRVESVDVVDAGLISEADVTAAGYSTADELRLHLNLGEDRQLYRVEFSILNEPDPREVLANDTNLDAADIADIDQRLGRLDRASKSGAWTTQTLGLIAEYPAVRAPDLAQKVGSETPPFKLNVRKLKNLGLTFSLKRGYKLSPRGHAYMLVKGLNPRSD